VGRSEEQALHNETVFREANDRIAERRSELGTILGSTPFLCECEDETCTAIVRLTPGEYEQVRARTNQFLVANGHPTRGTATGLSGAGWVCVDKE